MKHSTQSSKGGKLTITIALCGLLALGALIIQWRMISQLRRENLALRSAALVIDDAQHAASVSGAYQAMHSAEPAASPSLDDGESVQNEKRELLRLRNEVRQLRARAAQSNISPDHSTAPQPAATAEHNQFAQGNPKPVKRLELSSEWRDRAPLATNKYAQAMDRLTNANHYIERFHALGDVAKMSYAFGNAEAAQASATELLALADRYKAENWSKGACGQAIHDGNLVLGRLALEQGAIDDAKRYLLEAGTSRGSPVLGSFGPNMSLASDLLEQGERDTVLQYFERCANFWKVETLKQWSDEVNAGRIPNFGANLIY
jgi:hypothetical protein